MRQIVLAGSIVVVLMLAAACAGDGGPERPAPEASELVSASRPLPTPLETPLETPPTTSSAGPGATGEAPADLLARIVQDAATRQGVSADRVSVIRDESVTWNDGSLGCPEPGMSYTQAVVPGYWVVVDVAGEELDYRATQRGSFVLCSGGGLPPGSSTTR